MVAIADPEAAAVPLQGDQARFEDLAVEVFEQGEEDPPVELAPDGVPVDVEEACGGGLRAGLEHAEPRAVRPRDPHVIRHDVDDPAHAELAEPGEEPLVRRVVADLGAHPAVVEDVVSVGAPRPGLEVGRQVAIADAQAVEIVDDPGDVVEPELPVDLNPIGGAGTPQGLLGQGTRLGLEDRLGQPFRRLVRGVG